MISPCQCRGSAQYIHPPCLQKWIVLNGEIQSERLTCAVCKTPFLSMFNDLEYIYPRVGVLQFLLYYPLVTALSVQYAFFIFTIHDTNKTAFNHFTDSQIALHAIYLVLYGALVRVKNVSLYTRLALQRRSYGTPFLHGLFLWMFFTQKSILMAFAADLTLSLYWREHMSLLNGVNDFLLKI